MAFCAAGGGIAALRGAAAGAPTARGVPRLTGVPSASRQLANVVGGRISSRACRFAQREAFIRGVAGNSMAGTFKIPCLNFPSKKSPRATAAAISTDSKASTSTPAPGPTTTWTLELLTHTPCGADVADMGLKLTVISLEGKEATVLLDDKAKGAPAEYKRYRPELLGRKDEFELKLPVGFEPAAVKLKNLPDKGAKIFQLGGKYERIFVRSFKLQTSEASADVSILANSFVSPNQDPRLFVRDDAWTNPQLRANAIITALQETELQEMRGEGKNIAIADKERVPGDRIYRFQPYNDLGKDPKDPKNVRPTLGGSPEFPYPRRLATNREHYPGTEWEKPPTSSGVMEQILGFLGIVVNKAQRSPWVPEDDNFSSNKSQGFLGTAILGALPSVLDQIGGSLTGPGKEFDSIAEVFSIYDQEALGAMKSTAGGKDFASIIKKGSPSATVFNVRNGLEKSNSPSEFAPIDLIQYDAPRSLAKRLTTWASDEEFGRFFLAGQNPVVLHAVDSQKTLQKLLGSSAIEDKDILNLLEGKTFSELAAEAEGGADRRLFVVDYWALFNFLEETNKEKGKVQHAGRAVLFRRSDSRLVPVAIELTDKKTKAPTVYSANDPSTVWLLAKCIFQSVDSGYHQLVSHFVRTHACEEPYLISLRRHLSPTHPVFRLLMPHFRYTLPINAAARSQLINVDGVIEANFSPGPFAMALSSKAYGLTWQFKDEGLPADLRKRGITDASGNLKVSDYPYAEDGLLIWSALHQYFRDYVDYYYKSDSDVQNDKHIKAWWKDVRENGHPDIKAGWIELTGKASLVDILCTIAWVASAHHAAVNFGQYDYSAWPVSHASLCRKAAPERGSKEWEELAGLDVFSQNYQAVYEKKLLSYLVPPKAAASVISTVKLLSAHAEDEQYLTAGPERQDWLPLDDDPKLKSIFLKFLNAVNAIDATVDERNQDPKNLSRVSESGGLAYTLLRPTSEEPGVTFKGVPYSISI